MAIDPNVIWNSGDGQFNLGAGIPRPLTWDWLAGDDSRTIPEVAPSDAALQAEAITRLTAQVDALQARIQQLEARG